MVESTAPVVTAAAPAPQQSTPTVSTRYVGFGRRFVAYIIDAVIVGVVNGMAQFVITTVLTSVHMDTLATLLSIIVSLSISAVYAVGFLLQQAAATPGKIIMGIKIVTMTGEPLTVGRILMREILGKFISSLVLGLGYLWVIWDGKKQGWHDKIAGTYVVYSK